MENIMRKWILEGKLLPKIDPETSKASVAEIRRKRESGETPVLTDDSPMSELVNRAKEASERWKANRSL